MLIKGSLFSMLIISQRGARFLGELCSTHKQYGIKRRIKSALFGAFINKKEVLLKQTSNGQAEAKDKIIFGNLGSEEKIVQKCGIFSCLYFLFVIHVP